MNDEAPTGVKRKAYATTAHPTIAAVVSGQFRFPSEALARQRLEVVRNHFVLSKQVEVPGQVNPEELLHDSPDSFVLWIKGYAVTEEELKAGYLGQFGKVFLKKLKDGKFTLMTEKVEVPLKRHPQKKRLPQRHPNWGHPVLRSVKNERVFPTVEDAMAALASLHEEYPEVSIPAGDKLYVITYSRAEAGDRPIKKHILELKALPEGGCIITARENKKPFQPKVAAQPQAGEEGTTAEAVAPEASTEKPAKKDAKQGYFTAMVEIKRSKKKPTVVRKTPKKTDGE